MFTLLQEDILYKKVITTTGGSYSGGVWIPGEEEINYEEIEGIFEPYLKSEQSIILSEGVSNSDALVLFSPSSLKTHQSLKTGSTLADIVFVVDPKAYLELYDDENFEVAVDDISVEYLFLQGYEDQIANRYIVWDKMTWLANTGFTLIDDHYEYILIREDRV